MSNREDNSLNEIFLLQNEFMKKLRDSDILPEFPVDLTSKSGQRLLRETILNMIEEVMEASFCLRNKVHRLTDDRSLDREHFLEEMGDTLAYFVEACILSGITADEIYDEYTSMNELDFTVNVEQLNPKKINLIFS